MITNNHRKNTDFGLRYFLAGGCFTPDGAYALIYAQTEETKLRLETARASVLRQDAKIGRLKQALTNPDLTEFDRMELEADEIEYNAHREMFEINYRAVQQEYDTLNALLDELRPLCKYDTSNILELEQLAQRDEWIGEMKARAENMMLSNVIGIPYDHLSAMRQHPDFKQKILPHLHKISTTIRNSMQTGKPQAILDEMTSPLLLENTKEE